ncbi:sulfotransferase family cytosolic 1B member 1 [Drosophila grimshawi]|uniref:sulfotransferase family cytosolic 1B member 1 n=1 Tax=Drosophila grimshawi TaxID=7222 RepID=UPI0013EF1296|nr:sulfotransferase family cytosolic 1B member 1 [Drosophila grimshawi]
MYESESLKTLATKPMMRMRCTGELDGSWLPLKQDWSTRWCTLPEMYKELCAQRIHNFETRESDVFVVTFMKSGTTWMQELAWLLLNQLDFNSAKGSFLFDRSQYIERLMNHPSGIDTITACEKMISPRLIKSHLPAQLLPREIWQEGRKIIYIARNPKDVVVSSYHFLNAITLWKGDLDTFVDEFVNDQICYTSYWSHVIDFWRMRNEPNIFFATYEEMKRDLRNVIERLCKFLAVPNVEEEIMNQLLHHLSFDTMKGSEHNNPTRRLKQGQKTTEDFEFMRRGIVGSYKDELSAVAKEKMDKWTKDSLKDYGITESDIFGEI